VFAAELARGKVESAGKTAPAAVNPLMKLRRLVGARLLSGSLSDAMVVLP
jgi:hypothetical protein